MTVRNLRPTDDVAEAIDRMIRALGRRIATEDPDALAFLELVDDALTDAWSDAVNGLRRAGASDADIGRELGITRQAVRQRWPRQIPAPRGRKAQGYR